MNIYIDDLRVVPLEYDLVFRTGEHLLEFLDDNHGFEINKLSLDHDLGQHVMNGYELTKKLVNRIQDGTLKINNIVFHTANPTGHKNMVKYFENAKKVMGLGINIDTDFHGF